jgi:hypothetical protein
MADENQTEDPEPLSGQLVPGNQNVPVAPTRSLLRRLFEPISRFPILNRFHKKSIESRRGVIEEITKLNEAVEKHQRTRDRLHTIQTLIDTDRDQRLQERIEARNKLNEALLEHETWKQKQKIAKANKDMEVKQAELKKNYELQKQELEYKKAIAELKKQVDALEAPAPAPARVRTRGRSEKQKRIERARKRYDRELERIEAMTASRETKTALRQAANIEYEEEVERIVHTPGS